MPPVNQSQDCCPVCSSSIEEYLINLETRMSMCENVKCTYPFNSSNPSKFVVKTIGTTTDSNSGCGPLKGKKRSKPLLDQTHKSVNGKKQETYSLTSPIKQKDTPLVLALPSKTTSTGSVLATTARTSDTSTYTQDPHPPKRYRSQSTMAQLQSVRPAPLPEAAPVMNNTSSNCNYTLADIESLLNDGDEDNGSTVVTPKEDSMGSMNPMVWLDDMFEGQDNTDINFKCNPLQTDQDLDSLLGLSLFQ